MGACITTGVSRVDNHQPGREAAALPDGDQRLIQLGGLYRLQWPRLHDAGLRGGRGGHDCLLECRAVGAGHRSHLGPVIPAGLAPGPRRMQALVQPVQRKHSGDAHHRLNLLGRLRKEDRRNRSCSRCRRRCRYREPYNIHQRCHTHRPDIRRRQPHRRTRPETRGFGLPTAPHWHSECIGRQARPHGR